MGEKITYWAATGFSALALILVVTNITLSNSNRHLQGDISTRQAQIVAGQPYAQLGQGLIQAMADAAVKNNDTQMRALLTEQGITLKAPPAAAAAPAKAADKPDTTKK